MNSHLSARRLCFLLHAASCPTEAFQFVRSRPVLVDFVMATQLNGLTVGLHLIIKIGWTLQTVLPTEIHQVHLPSVEPRLEMGAACVFLPLLG